MPVTYHIDGKLVLIVCEGEYAPGAIPEAFQAAISDPDFPVAAALVLDVTKSKSMEHHSADEIRWVAQYLKPYAERINYRCAVVATRDVHYGLSRMGSVYSEEIGVQAEVFRDLDSALTWLDVAAE